MFNTEASTSRVQKSNDFVCHTCDTLCQPHGLFSIQAVAILQPMYVSHRLTHQGVHDHFEIHYVTCTVLYFQFQTKTIFAEGV